MINEYYYYYYYVVVVVVLISDLRFLIFPGSTSKYTLK
jgi:hypothetical protein